MAWAKGRYYRRSQRQGRRVTTQYLGSGWLAQAAATIDAAERAQRDQARQELAALRETLADSPALIEFSRQARLLIDAALIAAGYHRHKRQWRKRRQEGSEMAEHTALEQVETPRLDWQELLAALVAADEPKPDPGALPALRRLLAAYPGAWQAAGDLAKAARQNLLSRATSPATQESTYAGMRQLRKELRGEQSSAIEDLAIDAILTAWVDYHLTMLRFARLDGTSLAVADYWQRRLSLTQGRYLRTLRTLATIRRASINLQINIADQQVNITEGG